jgi:uncharacterized membrane protein
MTLLALGLLLFAVVHFIPSLAPSLKDSWYNRLGEGGYKGTFSLLLLTSFAMMIFGWRGAQATFIYQPGSPTDVSSRHDQQSGFIIFITARVLECQAIS